MADNRLGITNESKVTLAANTAATVASFIPGAGLVLGPLISIAGGVIGNFFKNQDQIKKIKREMDQQLAKRYSQTVFGSAIERLVSAMEQMVELGLKPNTPEFEEVLEQKLYPEIGYKKDCNIELWNPGIPGRPETRFKQAFINNSGIVTNAVGSFDLNNGPLWVKACKEIKTSALQHWAEQQQADILFQKSLEQEREDAKRKTITYLLMVGGAAILLSGFIIRQKKKLRAIKLKIKESKNA